MCLFQNVDGEKLSNLEKIPQNVGMLVMVDDKKRSVNTNTL